MVWLKIPVQFASNAGLFCLETMAFNCRETLTHFVSRRAAVRPQSDRT